MKTSIHNFASAILLVFFHCFVANGQETEPEWMTSPTDAFVGIAGHVMNHRALTTDPTELRLLADALDRHDRRIPPQENIEQTRNAFAEADRRHREWSQLERDRLKVTATVRALGSLAGGLFGGALGGPLRAITVPLGAFGGHWIVTELLDDTIDGQPVLRRSIERQAQDKLSTQGVMLMERARRAGRDEGFWPVWSEGGFEERTGIALDADPPTVLANSGTLMEFLEEKGIYDDIVAGLESQPIQPDLGPDPQTALRALMNEISPMLAEVQRGTQDVVATSNYFSESAERWVVEERRREERRRQEEDALRRRADFANARSAIGLAATVIGLENPDAGRKISAVTDGVFEVHDTIRAFELATGAGARADLAGAALTGNLLAIGLSVIGAFADDGPTPEQIILEEIGKLREQVRRGFADVHTHLRQVQREMNGRFDDMDVRFDEMNLHFADVIDQINSVNEKLTEGFSKVLEQGGKVRDDLAKVRTELKGVATQLERIEDNQRTIAGRMVRDHENLERLIIDMDLAECLVERRGSMTDTLFDTCLGRFDFLTARWRAGRSVNDSLEELLLVVPFSTDRSNDEFRRWLDSTTYLSFEKFRQLLASVGGNRSYADLPESGVVGPVEWFALVDAYDYFLEMYPDYAADRRERIAASDTIPTMNMRRRDLRLYLNAIRNELQAFQRGSMKTVFSRLFDELWNGHTELDALIQGLRNDYYNDETVVPFRVRENVPEVAHDNPYSWAPMSHFYDHGDVLHWLTIHRYGGCELEQMERRVGGGPLLRDSVLEWSPPSDRWFRGSGILNYLHPDDLIPARFGMGEIEVCVTGANTDRVQQLAMQIWFSSRDREVRQACGSLLLYDEVVGDYVPGNEFDLSGLLLQLAARVRERNPILFDGGGAGEATSECGDLYRHRFELEQQKLSDYVRERLSEENSLREIAQKLNVAHAYLRSWIALTLDNAMTRSTTVAIVASGEMFPDVEAMLREAPDRESWKLADDLGDRLRALQAMLRSREMRDALTYGSGHRWLTGTSFEVLGDLQ